VLGAKALPMRRAVSKTSILIASLPGGAIRLVRFFQVDGAEPRADPRSS
jgi:hypothetical protein